MITSGSSRRWSIRPDETATAYGCFTNLALTSSASRSVHCGRIPGLGVGYLRLLDGCAVVSDIEWIREPACGIGAWMPCPVRVYHNDERDDALTWLTSLPEGVDVSARDMAKAYLGGVGGGLRSLGGLLISKGVQGLHGTR